jgi:HicA toxin of bacterial toxin-antitoxin,
MIFDHADKPGLLIIPLHKGKDLRPGLVSKTLKDAGLTPDSGRLDATYTPGGSRAELDNDPIFGPTFRQARQRVAVMDIRYVEETAPVRGDSFQRF